MIPRLPILYDVYGNPVYWDVMAHMAVAGSTGSGKTTFLKYLCYLISRYYRKNGELYILDYKNSTDFKAFRNEPNYYGYDQCIVGFEKLYNEFLDRLEGRSVNDSIVFVILEEFASFQASFREKKQRDELQFKLSQMLRLSRSVGDGGGFRLILCSQQMSASIFGGGTADRDNLGTRILLGGGATSEGRRMMFDISDDDIIPQNSPVGKGYFQQQGGRIQRVISPLVENLEEKGFPVVKEMLRKQ